MGNVSCIFKKMNIGAIVLRRKFLLENDTIKIDFEHCAATVAFSTCIQKKLLFLLNVRTHGKQSSCEPLYHLAIHVYFCILERIPCLACCRTLPPLKATLQPHLSLFTKLAMHFDFLSDSESKADKRYPV